ncbi:extracellular solute-binding protein [Bradyrhizobium sp. CB3481]|uniref:extracellular solute-binding protein n=1 Tax=Bradyrhizobium sp. CB3481 TaxID=3039158 RepID=UPI0024B20E49|nr:extracellular solute-binding protein [Bradyrhizobium sp. CB3481]WFU20639.1 extracellular solute-binding protein [Bradyrhizobium sp. CB3481]
MARAAEIFAEHGTATISFQKPTPFNSNELLKRTLLQAVTGGLPDVSFPANNHVLRLVSDGIAQPLDNLAATDTGWASAKADSAIRRLGEVDGRLYGVPFQISVPVCIVNLALAERAGANPKALPEDWPGLLDLAKRITALGDGLVGGFFDLGGGDWTFQALITAQGGQMATPDGRDVAFDGPVGMAAMEVLRGFGEAGMVDMTQAQALQAFGAGTIGVLATSNNVLTGLEKQAAGRFAIATVPWPLTASDGRVPAGGRTGVIFTKDPERRAAAWAFLRFMSGPEIQTLVVKSTGAIPVDPEVVKGAKFLGDFYAQNPNHQAGLARSRQLVGWYSYPGANTVQIRDLMIDQLRQVATLRATPGQTLKTMSQAVRALLPQ